MLLTAWFDEASHVKRATSAPFRAGPLIRATPLQCHSVTGQEKQSDFTVSPPAAPIVLSGDLHIDQRVYVAHDIEFVDASNGRHTVACNTPGTVVGHGDATGTVAVLFASGLTHDLAPGKDTSLTEVRAGLGIVAEIYSSTPGGGVLPPFCLLCHCATALIPGPKCHFSAKKVKKFGPKMVRKWPKSGQKWPKLP